MHLAKPRTWVTPLVTGAACLLAEPLLTAHHARAQSLPVFQLELTHNAVDTTDTPTAFDRSGRGNGFDLGLGLRSSQKAWLYTSELVVGFHDFDGPLDPKVSRLMLGSRLGLDWSVRPSVFAHFGVGHLSVVAPFADVSSRVDFGGDVGLALDVSVVPGVEVGVEGSSNWQGFSHSFDWLQAGAHVTFVVGG